MNSFPQLTIGALAAASDVSVEAVRYYQRRGLLREPDRPSGSIRRYGQADVARLRFVKAAQRLGFSLEEIGALLRLEDETHCRDTRELAQRKLDDVRERLAALRRVESVLAHLVRDCGEAQVSATCPMIAALQAAV